MDSDLSPKGAGQRGNHVTQIEEINCQWGVNLDPSQKFGHHSCQWTQEINISFYNKTLHMVAAVNQPGAERSCQQNQAIANNRLSAGYVENITVLNMSSH